MACPTHAALADVLFHLRVPALRHRSAGELDHRVGFAQSVGRRLAFGGVPHCESHAGWKIGAGVPAERGKRVAILRQDFQKSASNQSRCARDSNVQAVSSLTSYIRRARGVSFRSLNKSSHGQIAASWVDYFATVTISRQLQYRGSYNG